MRVTLVIHSLSSGGAERVLVLLARGLASRNHHVSVITMAGRGTDFYALPGVVNRVALEVPGSRGVLHAIWNNIQRHVMLRRVIRSLAPDIVISFTPITNVRVLLACRGLGLPVVVTEHCDPTMIFISMVGGKLRRWLYPSAARLVSVSGGVDQRFSWMPDEKRAVIYNPLPDIQEINPDNESFVFGGQSRKRVVAMGRLTPQKGFDLLIDAFARIAPMHPEWDLYILGEGEQRAELESDIHARKLNQRIFLVGNIKEPFSTLRKADLFVMSSRFEGFGNALAEAMACGLPAISFDCPSGPGEIISHGLDGILVPPGNAEALARAMADLMSDEPKRQQFGKNALRVRERFACDGIVDSWDRLIHSVTKARARE